MYGRVGKLKARVGKRKNFSALRAEFCPPWPQTLPAPLDTVEPSLASQDINPIAYAPDPILYPAPDL